MTQEGEYEKHPMPEGDRVADDVHCRNCGYNLRTLSAAGRCPECGEPVAVSIRREWLREADPKWLSMVRMGLAMSAVGCLAIAAVSIDIAAPWRALLPQSKVFYISLVLVAAGAWAMGASETGESVTVAYRRRRSGMRWFFIVALGIRLFLWVVIWAGNLGLPRNFFGFAGWVAVICRAAGITLQVQVVGGLAKRVPDKALAKWARVVCWSVPATLLLDAPLGAVALFARTTYFWLIGIVSLNVMLIVARTTMFLCGLAWLATGAFLAVALKCIHQQLRLATIHAGQSAITPPANDPGVKPET